MMTNSDSLLETLQADIYAILDNTPGLHLANLLSDNDGDIENKVAQALQTLTSPEDKIGLAVVVLPPEVVSGESNLPGPPLLIKVEVQTIEHVLINRDADKGTGKRSSQAALCVMGALHLQTIGGHSLYADQSPISPVPVESGYVSHAITIYASADGFQGPGKVAAVTPEIDEETGEITITTTTANAAIYWTDDGSYPAPPAADLYGSPIGPFSAGTVIRAAAYAPDLNPGDCVQFTIKA